MISKNTVINTDFIIKPFVIAPKIIQPDIIAIKKLNMKIPESIKKFLDLK